MRISPQLTLVGLVGILLVVPSVARAQWQKKPYEEWSEKEALSVLNNSPWAQTQSATDTSRMFDTGVRVDSNQTRIAEVSQTQFRIRFFSARPIRQATSRLIQLKQKGQVSKELGARLQALAQAEFPDYIVVTVVTEYADSKSRIGEAATLLDRQSTAQLKGQTYLSVGGHRAFLLEYQPPRNDGFGARFIFPRMLDGKPLISNDSGEISFHAELVAGPTLNMRFKIKEMIFDGKVEY